MKEIIVKPEKLKKLYITVFKKINVPSRIYNELIDSLIETSLRGVDSHGVRLLSHYVQGVMVGRINKNPKLIFKKTSPTTTILDADHAFGITAGLAAMRDAVKIAQKVGLASVAVKNSSHFGAAAIFSLYAAKKNMIGISFTHADSLVLPHGGKRVFLGTNPICFAAPVDGEDPFCLDMATSHIPWNKLLVYRLKNKKLEKGWAADSQGNITVDSKKAMGLLPLGAHKGYGLGLVVEILCSLLTGMKYGPHISPMYPLNSKKRNLGHFFIAINIEKFVNVLVFKKELKKLLKELRKEPTAAGYKKVQVPGDPEKEMYKLRIKHGIPLFEKDMKEIQLIVQELGLMKEYQKVIS